MTAICATHLEDVLGDGLLINDNELDRRWIDSERPEEVECGKEGELRACSL